MAELASRRQAFAEHPSRLRKVSAQQQRLELQEVMPHSLALQKVQYSASSEEPSASRLRAEVVPALQELQELVSQPQAAIAQVSAVLPEEPVQAALHALLVRE